MAYKLICPECLSDRLEQHPTAHSKTEKFKCLSCGKVRLITKMQYVEIFGEDPMRDLKDFKKQVKKEQENSQ